MHGQVDICFDRVGSECEGEIKGAIKGEKRK